MSLRASGGIAPKIARPFGCRYGMVGMRQDNLHCAIISLEKVSRAEVLILLT